MLLRSCEAGTAAHRRFDDSTSSKGKTVKFSGLAVIAGLSILSSSAMAEVYVGVGAGLTHSNATNGIGEVYVHDSTDQKDQTDVGAIIYGGYAFNKYLAVEADVVDMGSYTWKAQNNGYTISAKVEAQGYTVGVVGTYPLSDKFGLDGKIGIGAIDQKFRCLASCDIPDTDTTTTVLVGAIGAHWDALQNLRIRASYEHLGGGHFKAYYSDGEKFTKTADFGLLYAGAELRF